MWNAGGKLPVFEEKQTSKWVKFQEAPTLYCVEADLPRSTSVFKFVQMWPNLNPPSPREKVARPSGARRSMTAARNAIVNNHLPQQQKSTGWFFSRWIFLSFVQISAAAGAKLVKKRAFSGPCAAMGAALKIHQHRIKDKPNGHGNVHCHLILAGCKNKYQYQKHNDGNNRQQFCQASTHIHSSRMGVTMGFPSRSTSTHIPPA